MSDRLYEFLLGKVRENDTKSFLETIKKHDLFHDDNYYDFNLLVEACKLGRKEIVNALLNAHSRMNALDNRTKMNTPLHLAAERRGWSDIVERLVKKGADFMAVNEDGNTALHVAFLNKAEDKTMEVLLNEFFYEYTEEERRKDVFNRDEIGYLHMVALRGTVKQAREVLDRNVLDINAQVSSQSQTPYAGYAALHFAVEARHGEMISLLIEWGGRLSVFTPKDTSPLHLALEMSDFDIVDLLCDSLRDFKNYRNNNGTSHFMAACASGDPKIVMMFLKNPVEWFNDTMPTLFARVKNEPWRPNAGYSPLHFACLRGRIETVNILLSCGVHMCRSTSTLTPMDIVRRQFKLTTLRQAQLVFRPVYYSLLKHCQVCKECFNLVYPNEAWMAQVKMKASHNFDIEI